MAGADGFGLLTGKTIAFSAHLLSEVAAERLPPRRPRHNPRAVKRKMSNFPRKRPPPPDAPSVTAPVSVRILRA